MTKLIQRFFAIFSLMIITLISLTACSSPKEDQNVIKVGTISGPETELMNVAKKVAYDRYHLDVKVVEFTDYSQLNSALNEGVIDANAFQHKPYLDAEIKQKGYHLVSIGNTFVYPMAIYSDKVKNIQDVKEHAIVAIPNDASNEARALLLLSQAKLIKLRPEAGALATPKDIVSNPLELQFKELDAAQLPRVLPDVTLSVINTNYAIPAGLFPTKDAIYVEDKASPYMNLIVVRANRAKDPRLLDLVKAYQSLAVLDEAKVLFKGQAIKGW